MVGVGLVVSVVYLVVIVWPRRDYTVMREVVDPGLWQRAREGRVRAREEGHRAAKREVKEEGGREEGRYAQWKKRKEDERRGERMEETGRRDDGYVARREERERWEEGRREDRRGRDHGEERSEYSERSWREEGRVKNENRRDDRRWSRDGGRREDRWCDGERRREGSRGGEERREGSRGGEERRGGRGGERRRPTAYSDEEGLEEVGRSGDFANWSTAVVKAGSREEEPSTSTHTAVARSEEEEVERLHKRVRDAVCGLMNKYWPDARVRHLH